MLSFISRFKIRHPMTAILILGLVAMPLLFNNCSQPGELMMLQASVTKLATDDQVQSQIRACNEALAAGKIQTLNQDVVFDDSEMEANRTVTCPFAAKGTEDALGNMDMAEGQLRARYEQERRLQVPANAILCDIKMTNDLQSFRYDDVFFLNFNGYILASNDKTAIRQRIQPESIRTVRTNAQVNIYKYHWMSLRTARFENVADDFCLGNEVGYGNCSWPVTEEDGNIKFSWDPEVFIRMSANVPANQQTFSFVTTGDDNPDIDCYHEKLKFSMSVKYFIP